EGDEVVSRDVGEISTEATMTDEEAPGGGVEESKEEAPEEAYEPAPPAKDGDIPFDEQEGVQEEETVENEETVQEEETVVDAASPKQAKPSSPSYSSPTEASKAKRTGKASTGSASPIITGTPPPQRRLSSPVTAKKLKKVLRRQSNYKSPTKAYLLQNKTPIDAEDQQKFDAIFTGVKASMGRHSAKKAARRIDHYAAEYKALITETLNPDEFAFLLESGSHPKGVGMGRIKMQGTGPKGPWQYRHSFEIMRDGTIVGIVEHNGTSFLTQLAHVIDGVPKLAVSRQGIPEVAVSGGIYNGIVANKKRLLVMKSDCVHLLKYQGFGRFEFERTFRQAGCSPVPTATGILTTLLSDDVLVGHATTGIASFRDKKVFLWGDNGLEDAATHSNTMVGAGSKTMDGAEIVPKSLNGAVLVLSSRASGSRGRFKRPLQLTCNEKGELKLDA
ncbi:MAG: hypothetical protein SGARI_004325, partial [Bacillariaceae sp.]